MRSLLFELVELGFYFHIPAILAHCAPPEVLPQVNVAVESPVGGRLYRCSAASGGLPTIPWWCRKGRHGRGLGLPLLPSGFTNAFAPESRVPTGDAVQTCLGGGAFYPHVAVSSLRCYQEGHGQTAGYIGSSRFEHSYQVSSIQNADLEGCQTPPSRGVFHGVSGPQGWVLARAHCSIETTLPGVPLSGDEVPVSGLQFGLNVAPRIFTMFVSYRV